MNNLSNELKNVKTYCINLKKRKDRKIKMKRMARKKQIKFTLIKGIDNGHIGCKKTHCQIIKNAVKNKHDIIWVMEDDIKIVAPLQIKECPKNWDILFLGGEIIKKYNLETTDKEWIRCQSHFTHSYIINLKNENLVNDILAIENNDEIESYKQFMTTEICKKYFTYVHNPILMTQYDNYSDCEKQDVSYEFNMLQSVKGLKKAEYSINKNGEHILRLDKIENYPFVSILTPTFNRRNMFPIAIRNFFNFNYPPEKLQWVIVDDSTDDSKSVKDLIPPNDNRIKYIRLDKWIPTMGEKRNICVQNADHEIILHMDDDDYYPPESIYARVAVLLKYHKNGIRLIGSSQLGVYDILENSSNLVSDGEFSFSEGTMGYFKSFWEETPFNKEDKTAEYISFMEGRFNKIMDIPYSYIMIGFKHGQNTVVKKIQQSIINKDTKENHNFIDDFDKETKDFILQLQKYIRNKIDIEIPDFSALEI
jgi:GR25 family glycosyltransferase involved in LPS biosynthesis